MAGAARVLAEAIPPAPIAAVRKNLRRCMLFLPGTFFVLPVNFHSAERACHAAQGLAIRISTSPADGGGETRRRSLRLVTPSPQSLSAADMRAMKESKPPSHTRNHRISSLRNGRHDS